MSLAKILPQFEEFLKKAEEILTFERVFEITGVSDALKKMYITPKDLRTEYVNILYKGIKKFISSPLYKNLRINNVDDLVFLNKSDDFQEEIKVLFEQIKKSLSPRELKLLDYFKQFDKKSEIKLEKIISDLKIDKASLLFMLDDLKEHNKIYDYNGREVNL